MVIKYRWAKWYVLWSSAFNFQLQFVEDSDLTIPQVIRGNSVVMLEALERIGGGGGGGGHGGDDRRGGRD